MTNDVTNIRVSLDSSDVPAFRAAMARASYDTVDTGERVTTDAGPDGEAVLLVKVPREVAFSRADRVAELLVP